MLRNGPDKHTWAFFPAAILPHRGVAHVHWRYGGWTPLQSLHPAWFLLIVIRPGPEGILMVSSRPVHRCSSTAQQRVSYIKRSWVFIRQGCWAPPWGFGEIELALGVSILTGFSGLYYTASSYTDLTCPDVLYDASHRMCFFIKTKQQRSLEFSTWKVLGAGWLPKMAVIARTLFGRLLFIQIFIIHIFLIC